MQTYTFHFGVVEEGIAVTEQSENARLADFDAHGEAVEFSIFFKSGQVSQSDGTELRIGDVAFFGLSPDSTASEPDSAGSCGEFINYLKTDSRSQVVGTEVRPGGSSVSVLDAQTEPLDLDIYCAGVEYSVFFDKRYCSPKGASEFGLGYQSVPVVKVINRNEQSDGSAFCLLEHYQGEAIVELSKTSILARVPDQLTLVRIKEGGHIIVGGKVGHDKVFVPVWKIYNIMGALKCQLLQWAAPWVVQGQHLFARLDDTSMLRVSLDRPNHLTLESQLELLSDDGWKVIARRSATATDEFVKGKHHDDRLIARGRLAARNVLARELCDHAAFLYPGRLSAPVSVQI